MQQIKIIQSVTARTMTVDSYLRNINSIPMVTPDEETELADRIQKGDEDAYRRLVEANLRFVVSVAKQYQSSGLDLCDLINEGNLGLMKAARRFDPTRGFKFISYAVWWIRQQIMQAISEQGRMVRLPLNQIGIINRINRAKTQFEQENEREPSDRELAEFLDLTPDKIGEAVSHASRHMSFDTPFGEDGDGTLLDVVPDNDAEQADTGLQKESLRVDIQHVMMVLSQREREIVSLAFGIGCQEMTLEEIGERMDLTRERVRQVKEKAIRKMARPGVKDILRQYL
ncbi:MAG: RNA polymerase sigma factor RpoD/SigA [Bacteroidales bacterium]|uniref:sigma-70 family RNA polymerase sigma factor n=1 Tax=Candidatus Cryptobacteroides sp. TaxID=2952915 RepID=UPI002A758D1D|nr:RNA polymerase sigma factor RpoD/SigA [Candidatus Cryptobacteroides sp.]MDD7234264.1 RNA polymerase sigma factor RpoD/SigA [Bacteroidales bacterium]MDY2701267.1 RNA polymerase sigma factor RpoD/SigA [Candidatus Cryptobacteroides sp.]MDY5782243.1 RNA polymerase sigma factor RpoD/SigA [Candidatus Cryptobacteroides sp.]